MLATRFSRKTITPSVSGTSVVTAECCSGLSDKFSTSILSLIQFTCSLMLLDSVKAIFGHE